MAQVEAVPLYHDKKLTETYLRCACSLTGAQASAQAHLQRLRP